MKPVRKLTEIKRRLEEVLRFTPIWVMQPIEIFYKEAEDTPKFRITIEVMSEWQDKD